MDAEEILSGLNSDQRAAVLHDHFKNAQLLILAGAGSGKTSVLTKRIQYRILCGVEPEKILALTFTAKAAAEMRERVQKLFPNAGVRLCTFHSLALYMLKCKVPSKLTELGRSELEFRYAYELLGFKKMPVPTESSEHEISTALSKLKLKVNVLRENLFSDCYGASVSVKLRPLREQVLESGQVVFEDLIYLAIHLLENFENACAYFREQWKEILVDEYQDINPSQYRLVKNLLGERKELFVVGDDDQAIYGFRGADIGNIERFCEDYKDSTLIRLEWNYRSVPNVLCLANDIFKNKPIHLRKMLRAGNLNGSGGNPLYKENRKPEVWVSDNPVEEIQKIILSMKELRMDYDLAWKNFAILVRYNRQRLYYEEALRDYGIPIAGGEGANLIEDGVHIETVHASKGLQYTVVYYAGLCEKLTPGECTGNRKQRKKQLDEERRLYYVGVTRAEACLFLLYCKRRFWKGELRRFKRSRFLPKESKDYSVKNMPVILFKIYVATAVLSYMLMYILLLPFIKLRYGKNFDVWFERKIQDFSKFCMKVLRVDLTIEDQAQLGKVDWSRPVFVVGPVCFVCGMGRGFKDEGGLFTFDESLGLALNYRNPKTRITYKTSFYNLIKKKANASLKGELLRILYVALTRPVDKLIITGAVKPTSKKSVPDIIAGFTATGRVLDYATKEKAQSSLELIIRALNATGKPYCKQIIDCSQLFVDIK